MFAKKCLHLKAVTKLVHVYIGSCIPPILSDIFLAHHDRLLASRLDSRVVVKLVRFVDDFVTFCL